MSSESSESVESTGLSRSLWIVAGVLVMAGLIGAVVLTQRGSDDGFGSDAVAGSAETVAPEVADSSAVVLEVLFPVAIDGRSGFINRSGTLVIPAQYEDADYFSEGLAPVETADGWGYIDASGAWVVEPNSDFEVAFPFSEGLAAVRTEEGWGYIDGAGAWVIEPQSELLWALPFSEGLAAVKSVDGWGYIDGAGAWVIEPRFIGVREFSEGVAAAETLDGMGYIDMRGDWVTAPRLDARTSTFSEGMAAVTVGELWGYVDREDRWVIEPQFPWAGRFSEDLAPFFNGDTFGYIDREGSVVIPPIYDDARPFRDGLGRVVESQPDDSLGFGYVDTSGEWVWRPSS